MRQTFSGFRKKAKDKLSKLGDKLEGRRTYVDEEDRHRPASPLQSEPSGLREDVGIGAGKSDPRQDNPPPVSGSAVEIGQDHGGSNDGANAGEIGQGRLLPDSHAQTESGPSREGEDVGGESTGQTRPHPESDVGNMATPPSTSRDGETDGMWTTPFC